MSREGSSGPENRAERRSFRSRVADRLDALRLGPFDVLVLHLPPEVISDEDQFAQARAAAVEVMEAARRPVVLLPEGTDLTAESIEPLLRGMGLLPPERPQNVIHLPDRRIVTPE